MPKTKRAQVLLEPETYEKLEEKARREGVSVSELIRLAVDRSFLSSPESRRQALERIGSLDLPLGEWEGLEEEILDARGADLP